MTKKQTDIHGIVHASVLFPKEIPYSTARIIVSDVEQMLFESVALINGHYKEKFGFEHDILEVGYPPLEESMTPDEIKKLTIH